MTLKNLDTKIRAFLDRAGASGKTVADSADLASKLDALGDFLITIDVLPDPETFVAMTSKMPDIPPLSDVIKAFLPVAARVAEFVATTLGNNFDVLAALAADGGDPAPDKLKLLATKFAGTPQLKEMLDEGGLDDHLAAMAPVPEAVARPLAAAIPADQTADLFIAGIANAARAANMTAVTAVLRLPLDATAPEGAEPLAEAIAATKAAVER